MRTYVRHRVRRSAGSAGQAMVEFAVVGATLLLVLFAMMFMGDAVYTYNTMSQAAREAVRYAVVHSPTSPNPATTSQIQQVAINYADALGLTASNITVTWPQDPNINRISNKNDAYDAQVAITYTYKTHVPFLKAASFDLTSTSRMLVSQ
jgi:Flp pilus assembly protein TadG